MPAGRPTDYRSHYCQTVIELGKDGWSKAQIANHLDVSRNTLDIWAAAHDEFLSALTRARDASMAWWEQRAQEGLTNREFNANLWSRSMAGRFPGDYSSHGEVKVVGDAANPVSHEHTIKVVFDDPDTNGQ